MDVIRFGYSTSMVFSDGGPAIPITWFRAAKDALVFPGLNAFASTVYETDQDWGPLGEIQSQRRVWSNGQGPGVLVGKAPFTGQLDWYATGQPTPDLGFVPTIVGEPESCVSSDWQSGLGIGGIRCDLTGLPLPPGGSALLSMDLEQQGACTSWGFENVPTPFSERTGRWEGTLVDGANRFNVSFSISTLHQNPGTAVVEWVGHGPPFVTPLPLVGGGPGLDVYQQGFFNPPGWIAPCNQLLIRFLVPF